MSLVSQLEVNLKLTNTDSESIRTSSQLSAELYSSDIGPRPKRPTFATMPSVSTTFLASLLFSYLSVSYTPQYLFWSSSPSYTGTFFLTFFTQLLCKLFYKVVLYPHFLSPLRHLPSPSGASWWNGHQEQILAQSSGNPQIDWMENTPNNGLIRYKIFLNVERVMPTSPEVFKELLHTKSYIFQKPGIIRNGAGSILGRSGLLFSEGEQHRIQRRHMSPAFSVKQLQGMMPSFLAKSGELVDRLARELEVMEGHKAAIGGSGGNEKAGEEQGWNVIEMQRWCSRATLDIIGQTGFGYDFESLKDDENELAKAYKAVFSPVSRQQQLLHLLMQSSPQWLVKRIPSERNRRMQEAVRTVKDLCKRMIREKRRELEVGGKAGEKGWSLSIFMIYDSIPWYLY